MTISRNFDPATEPPVRGGILPSQWISAAVHAGIVAADVPITDEQIQPNSIDLRVGITGYRVQCSFLPGRPGMQSKINQFAWYEFKVADEGTILERNQVYLFPIRESLRLPLAVSARGNPKSSTGRLDIFSRLVTEHATRFDDVPAGYVGRLYLEVTPRSFAVRVRPGDSLAQLRFQTGDPRLSDAETRAELTRFPIVIARDNEQLSAQELRVESGIHLSVRLTCNGETAGYRSKKNTPPIDLRARKVEVQKYWERIVLRDSASMILEPDEFYIFASKELISLPGNLCAEMQPFDAESGELRAHYAGFFDSGFGHSIGHPATRSAAAAVLEVRNRDVPFLIEDGRPLFRIALLKNTDSPDKMYGQSLASNYQGQRLRLGKQFADDLPDGSS